MATCPNHPTRKAISRGLCDTCRKRAARGGGAREEVGADGQVSFRLPSVEAEMVEAAARREGCKPAEWHRRAVRERLLRQSVTPSR